MIESVRKLWRDRRGNALAIAGAALPLVVGSAGLATDTIQWALWKRQLQRAADSAAIAGSIGRFQGQAATASVATDLGHNNHLWVALLAGYPQVGTPADTTNRINQVTVQLRAQRELPLSSLFMATPPTIIVNATAGAVPSGSFCVVALENTTTTGITIQGSTNVNMGCGMISNSLNSSVSVGVNGNAHNVTAEPVAGVGGVPDINGVTSEQPNHLPQPDPFANKYSTTIPTDVADDCGNMNSHVVTPAPNPGKITLEPGCYEGNNQFKFNGGNYHLQPGVYYLNNIDFEATGGTITGDNVTIVLTGSSPGQLKLNGNATIQLDAPDSGDFEDMLLIQSPNATNSNNANVLNGSNTSSFDGRIYFPNQQVTFSGSTGAITKCAMVVARRVEFAGNANLQNNTTGCENNTQVTGWAVRLIA